MPSTTTLHRLDASFPSALRDINGWPLSLHCHGALAPHGLSVALVGARAASGSAMLRARDLAMELTHDGCRIISGGALGIDSAAHQGALTAGGITVAVMACGLDSYYPRRNQRLFEAIIVGGGAVVSPYEAGCEPLRGRFVKRNQIIAALADLVIVVEASTNSGSLHTARFAMDLGRKLAVVPGSPGCETLRAKGVPAIHNATDAMRILSGEGGSDAVALPPAGSTAAIVLASLSSREPRDALSLSAHSGLPVREISRVLLKLQLDLLAVALPGQRYLLSPLAAGAGASGPHG